MMSSAERRSRWRPLLALGVLLLGLTTGALRSEGLAVDRRVPTAPLAEGGEVSREAAAALAREAVDDDVALDRLRELSSIDGVPVDLAAATGDLGAARGPRLLALADEIGAEASTAADPIRARAQARSVLESDKYQQSDVPKPFKGVLEWMADRLRPVGRFLDRIFSPILDLPGGALILAVLLTAGVAAAAAWLASRRSGAALRARQGSSALVDLAADPADLERRAEECEAGGDLEDAVRLRFQAGLLRLVRSERITLRPDTTAADVARLIDEPTMDALTDDFEQIVYGDRSATAEDGARSRHGWSALTDMAVGRRR